MKNMQITKVIGSNDQNLFNTIYQPEKLNKEYPVRKKATIEYSSSERQFETPLRTSNYEAEIKVSFIFILFGTCLSHLPDEIYFKPILIRDMTIKPQS